MDERDRRTAMREERDGDRRGRRKDGMKTSDQTCIHLERRRSRSAAVAVSAIALACLSIVSVGRGRMPLVMQQQETTFVWADSPTAGHAAHRRSSGLKSPSLARPARIVAARGRLAARRQRLAETRREEGNPEPLGFDVDKTLDKAYRRGEEGSSYLIHIDLPIQQYQVGKTVGGGKPNAVPLNIDGTHLPAYLRLNKVEAATLKEEKRDPGGVARLKAMGSHFAHRVDKVLVSIGRKLKLAEEWRQEHHVANALSQLEAIQVPKADEDAWAKQMLQLDDVIAAHGGDPPALDSSMEKARKARTRQQQMVYQDALRRAFGKNPTLPVP